MSVLCGPSVIVYFFLCLSRLFPGDASAPSFSTAPDGASVSVSQPADSATDPDSSEDPGPASNNTKLYVLMYHHLIEDEAYCGTWTISEDRFRQDLQWLADHGYATVLPSELIAGKPLPEKAVMITFDDGYRSNYLLAYPLLQEFRAKAVISIVTQYTVDELPGFLTWDMCREMVQSGLVEIGSHTNNLHGDTGIQRMYGEPQNYYQARVLPDLQRSIDLIQENVGAAPQVFAYPNGLKDAWASCFIAENFAITLVTKAGQADIAKGLYSLPRYNVAANVPLSCILP